MTELTVERLREVLDYDPQTGVMVWRKTLSSRASAGSVAGGPQGSGYFRICIGKRKHYRADLAWLYVYGRWPSRTIDHKNGNRGDDRICNLREATRSQNNVNKAVRSDNRLGQKGVEFRPGTGFVAYIGVGGKKKHLGVFKSINEASAAYRAAAEKFHGEFAYHKRNAA